MTFMQQLPTIAKMNCIEQNQFDAPALVFILFVKHSFFSPVIEILVKVKTHILQPSFQMCVLAVLILFQRCSM